MALTPEQKAEIYIALGTDHARMLAQIAAARRSEGEYPTINGAPATPAQERAMGAKLKIDLDTYQAPFVKARTRTFHAFATGIKPR